MVKCARPGQSQSSHPRFSTLRSHSPLPSQSSEESGAQPLERNQEEAGSTGRTSQKLAKMILSPLESPREEKPKQIQEPLSPCQWVPLHLTCARPRPFSRTRSGQPAAHSGGTSAVQKRTSETEPSGDNLLSSKIERSSGGSKPFHRSRPGRPQSLILFSPPFPIMDHPPPSSTGTDSRSCCPLSEVPPRQFPWPALRGVGRKHMGHTRRGYT